MSRKNQPRSQKYKREAKPAEPVVESKSTADVSLVDANGKPLSGFALVKRRKELAAQAAKEIVNEASNTTQEKVEGKTAEPTKVSEVEVVETTSPKLVEQSNEIIDYSHEAYLAATPESKQAYSDLKQRIDSLISLQDTDLKNAMTELKKALMQNTNAVALMLPSDIGQMVIALRKMTGVELAKAEEKKTGKKGTGKAKEPMLSAEALEAAFQEL